MPHRERRHDEAPEHDEFSPEYLAMLVVCGGSVRDSDWAVLPEALASRRLRADPEGPPPEDIPNS